MCRMIAKVSIEKSTILNEMMQCPYSLQYLSEHGRQSENPSERGQHRDGCGIAFVENERIIIEKRTKENAWDASYIDLIKHATSQVFMGHNRKTSGGLETRIEGTHPFYFEKNTMQFAFSHNGTVQTLVPEAMKKSTSDSKLFFEQIITLTNNFSFEAVYDALTVFAKINTYDSLCAILISNANELYAWRIFNTEHTEDYERLNAYYTLYLSLRNDAAVIASEPLDEEPWMLLPNKSFIKIVPENGRLTIEYKLLEI